MICDGGTRRQGGCACGVRTYADGRLRIDMQRRRCYTT